MKIKQIVSENPKGRFDGWLMEWYGDHFAQISVDTTLKLKSAMKDVCRVLEGFVLPEVDAFSRKMPEPPQGVSDQHFVFGYEDSGGWHPGIIDTDPVLRDYIVAYPKHWNVVSKALGLARQKSRHACFVAETMVSTKSGGQKRIIDCDGIDVYTGQGDTTRPGVFAPHGVATLLDQGEREVTEYTLANGSIIQCTPDHQVLTEDGWMEIQKAFDNGIELSKPRNCIRLTERDATEYANGDGADPQQRRAHQSELYPSMPQV